jgi:glycosyltransferase involved in cell wall biosynthesis
MDLAIVTPVYNDWVNFETLLIKLDSERQIKNLFEKITVVAVNDGSQEGYTATNKFQGIEVIILNLNINLGHQRAIAIGLAYLTDTDVSFNYVIVMDSDGEDNPSYIPLLINKAEENKRLKIIFAKRVKRAEGFFIPRIL